MGNKKLYHYTSKEGLLGIKKSKKILQSDARNGDAAHGSGTYLTSLRVGGKLTGLYCLDFLTT